MIELNRAELRALRLGTGLLVVGCAVRLGCGPGPAEYAWRPTSGGSGGGRPSLVELREEVDEETRRAQRAATPLAPGERIDPNTAPVEELDRLPGIGPALAARIVASREAEGPFARPADLLRVSGVGPKTLARLREHVRVTARASARGDGRPERPE